MTTKMTCREFCAKLLTEHFVDKSINHLHSGWGHNFNAEFQDRRDSTYVAIRLILRFWNNEEGSINTLIAWLHEPNLGHPWNSSSTLAWNLYYSLYPFSTERDLRLIEKRASMYSLLRNIELSNKFDLLTPEQKNRLTDITTYIK